MNWDDLRTFEAVARRGSLTAAATALGVSQSTVSRRIARLEEAAHATLLIRSTPLRLSERGRAVLQALSPMLDGAQAVRAALETEDALRGEVTLTTIGELTRWVLAPRLSAFYARHPELRLHIRVRNTIDSLAAGEADVSLRISRPEQGDLIARRLSTTAWSLYASPELARNAASAQEAVPWLGLSGALGQIPEQRYAEALFGGRPPRLRIEDVEALGQAVQAGLGVALLPDSLHTRLEGLMRVQPEQLGLAMQASEVPARDIWMVVHRTRYELPRVRALIDWLENCFEASAMRAPGA